MRMSGPTLALFTRIPGPKSASFTRRSGPKEALENDFYGCRPAVALQYAGFSRGGDNTVGLRENPEEGQVDTMAWNVDALELFSNLL